MSRRPEPDARCLPWPPKPWPPVEQDPPGTDPTQPVDWLSHSHPQLYAMVHEDLDLTAVNRVAEQWAKLSKDLAEIRDDLRAAVEASAKGWEGDSAELARDTLTRLTIWTEETGLRAGNVSKCVEDQAQNAATAKKNMPEPPKMPFPQPAPLPMPDRGPMPVEGGTAAMSASPFTTGDFTGGPAIVADPEPQREKAQRLHEQAAQVMEQYQRDSGEIYHTVPDFSRPNGDQIVYGPPPEEPPKEPEPEPPPSEKPDDSTGSSSTGPGPGPGGGVPSQPGPGGAGTFSPGPGTGAIGGGGAVGEQLNPGQRVGSGQFGPGAGGAAAAAAASGRTGGMGMGMAGMPMMPPGAGQRGDEEEHRAPSYLQDDENIFHSDLQVAPPVLGLEDQPRRRDR
ncbi:PPE domain-containing protein [Amycolatopsis suaedae]|uniref:PPE domain-containing protein n=1 Tax=Amycolatopsis suaedae TaxID=2510978 RepID=A0A4Q7J6P2_9PSEU|nr:PPE domain-containing protein [Amycolatopsis suaedae]RZQ61993.1 PPE domain-containing protein [Amycolatopsis suaedae]